MELTSDTIMKLITSLLNKKWYEIITDISVDYQKTDSDSAITVYIEFAEGIFDSLDDDEEQVKFNIRSDIRDIVKYISPTFVFFRFNTI
tara:strand:- start:307 stop:573 length:267 start_codon:yes stop_codon:yes gene_type:complete